jgi:hypothetical protein
MMGHVGCKVRALLSKARALGMSNACRRHADPHRHRAKTCNAAQARHDQNNNIRKRAPDGLSARAFCATLLGLSNRNDIARFFGGHGSSIAKRCQQGDTFKGKFALPLFRTPFARGVPSGPAKGTCAVHARRRTLATAIWCGHKKAAKSYDLAAGLVAGVGFEPTTFRL